MPIETNRRVKRLMILTGTPRDRAFMKLIAKGMRIAHATLHESVGAALQRLTPELLVAAAQAVTEIAPALQIPEPSIGVFGINPTPRRTDSSAMTTSE